MASMLFDLNNNMMKQIENAQGGIMQRLCGIPKCSHHTVITTIKYNYAYKISNLNVYTNLISLYVPYVCLINCIYGL